MKKDYIAKLQEQGAAYFTDSELVDCITGAQTALFEKVNNLNELSKLSFDDLLSIGITHTKAAKIIAVFELGRRRQRIEAVTGKQFKQSREVYEYMHTFLGDLPHEELWILFLNQRNIVTKRIQVSKGGVSETSADIRIILKTALHNLSSNLIIVHNHPAGNSKPSHADDSFTEKLKQAAKLIDVKLLDHIIVADTEYYSYADDGKI